MNITEDEYDNSTDIYLTNWKDISGQSVNDDDAPKIEEGWETSDHFLILSDLSKSWRKSHRRKVFQRFYKRLTSSEEHQKGKILYNCTLV